MREETLQQFNKKVLGNLRENYSTERLADAISHFDHIRGIVDLGADECLRNDLFRLRAGISYLINDNFFFDRPKENLAELANYIEDQMFEIIEAAETIREALEPLLALGGEEDDESDSEASQF
jgi:hypothetical protein